MLGKGVSARDYSQVLAVAAIKFELLSVGLRNKVKVKMSDFERGGGVQDNQSGIFVMYNCARLNALMSKYDTAVNQDFYPPLPDIKTVDFSIITDQVH
jgi:arginyl-tRNA synthetase